MAKVVLWFINSSLWIKCLARQFTLNKTTVFHGETSYGLRIIKQRGQGAKSDFKILSSPSRGQVERTEGFTTLLIVMIGSFSKLYRLAKATSLYTPSGLCDWQLRADLKENHISHIFTVFTSGPTSKPYVLCKTFKSVHSCQPDRLDRVWEFFENDRLGWLITLDISRLGRSERTVKHEILTLLPP